MSPNRVCSSTTKANRVVHTSKWPRWYSQDQYFDVKNVHATEKLTVILEKSVFICIFISLTEMSRNLLRRIDVFWRIYFLMLDYSWCSQSNCLLVNLQQHISEFQIETLEKFTQIQPSAERCFAFFNWSPTFVSVFINYWLLAAFQNL